MANDGLKKPAFDPMTVAPLVGISYPPPFDAIGKARIKRKLGEAVGLTNFGVNLVHLKPGQGSSQRHWHTRQDEFIYILEGEATLITDAGEQIMTPGTCAGFPAGVEDGHHLVNTSDGLVVYLEIGDRTPGDGAVYPDIDLALPDREDGVSIPGFTHKDGTPYD